LLLFGGEYGIMKTVRAIYYDEPQTTYNLEVADYHTYCVGEQSVCAHDKCKPNIEQALPDGYKPIYENSVF